MSLPTESQWARYSALCAHLQAVPAVERAAILQALRAEGHEDPQVLSLVALHWALPPDLTRERTGDRLGDFILEEPLGAGGMGVVYRAQQYIGATTRPVAVKLIHPTLLQTAREEALARFQAEIAMLVKLEHEGIARIYGGGIAEDPRTREQLPYIAMELVRGGLPITTYVRDHALAWQERLNLFLRVCRAVQYAHEHRVIHRDLKPANILVDSEGCPFIIDFGLARTYDALPPGAQLVASGTPAYMSPEQVSDAFGPISAKSDVYTLGVILYELLTEQHPYALRRDGTFAQWYQVITEAPSPPLHQYSEIYGRELEEIMTAALAKRPGDRARVDVLRSRLERYLKNFPTDIDRSLRAASTLQQDSPTVPHQDDRVIAPVEVRQWIETKARIPTAHDMPMPAYRKKSRGMGMLLGADDAPRPAQARNRALPFVGRHQYLNCFETYFQEARAGHPHVVFLKGEAGVGKTRLLRELGGGAQHQGFQVWAGHCYEDMTLPYLPFIEALLSPLEQLPAEIQQVLAREAAVLHQFLHRVSFVTTAAQVSSAEETDRLHVFLAVSRILIALAQHHPLLLFLDDLHWADSPSLDLLSYIVFTVVERAQREPIPLAIISTFRPVAPEDRLARLLIRIQREEVCHLLDLHCLHEAEVHDLLQGLGLTHPSQQLVATVTEATQGNPLFIQEVVQYMLQQDMLRETGGYLVTTVSPADLRLPEEVTSAIARRIRDLSVPCQSLLTLAACLGERFAFDVLTAVCGESEETLLSLLEEGMQHRLLLSRAQVFEFAHPLIRQVFYHMPSVIRRQRLHHRIAQTLEQVHRNHREEYTLEIAHHLIRAGPVAAQDTVVAYARQAGDQACRAFAWGEAARYYEATLAAGKFSMQEQAVLHYRAGLAYHRDQDVGPCLEHYNGAITAYRMVGDVRGLAQVLMLKTELQYSLTSVPLGTLPDVQPLEEVLHALEDNDPGLRGRILNIIALAYRNARQTVAAQRMATCALEIGQDLQDDDLCARVGSTLGQIQLHNLQVKESLESYHSAVLAARRTGDFWLQGLPLQRAPLGFIMAGQLDAAETAALDACDLARTAQDWGNYSLPLAHLTYVQVAQGNWQTAQRYAQEALHMGARSTHPWGGTRTLFALACLHAFRGAWGDAEHQLDLLIEPGRIFREAGPMIRTVAEVLRRLIRTYAGRVDGDVTPLITALQQIVNADAYALAPCCALVELSDLMETPGLAERPAEVLARAAKCGVLFTPEWIFLVPRVLGLAAMLRRAWEQAESYFQAALTTAARVGAQPELARAYVDYARMLIARNQADDWHRARTFLAQAEPICQVLGMQPCAQRIVQLTAACDASRPALPQPDLAVPEKYSA